MAQTNGTSGLNRSKQPATPPQFKRRWPGEHRPASASGCAGRKIAGYGLPCAKCHLYYPADLDVAQPASTTSACRRSRPNCRLRVTQAAADPVPDTSVVEQEREEFLRQFKSQLLEAHAEVANVPESFCKFAEHHSASPGARGNLSGLLRARAGESRHFRSRPAPGLERSRADCLRCGLGGSFRP